MHEPAAQLLGVPDRGEHSDAKGRDSQGSYARSTSHFGSEANGIRLELSLAGCCCLSSSCWLAEKKVGGGRGLGGRQSCGQAAGIFTSCQQEVRVRRVLLRNQLTHIQPAKCLSAALRNRHHRTPCVSGGREAAVYAAAREAAHLPPQAPAFALPSGACLCLPSTCGRWWPREDRATRMPCR